MSLFYAIIYAVMFGYVCPKTCELKVCEFEEYKSYYCGLCKAVRKNYSPYAAAFLANDCVFMYILFSALDKDNVRYAKNRCVLHGRKCRYTAAAAGADYAAALNVLLAAEKLRDDIRDGGRRGAGLALFLLKPAERKAEKKYPEAADIIKSMTCAVNALEDSKSDDIDKVSHTFACMLGRVFENYDENSWEALYDIGYNLGRFIYIADAFDDLEADRRKGEYNVFVNRFGKDREQSKRTAEFNLFMSLSQAKKALDSLTIHKNQGILLNIMTLGLSEQAETVLKGEKA